MIENEQPEAAALKSGSSAPSVLGTRVPLWSLLLVAVVAAVVGIATYVLRDVPDLGAVGHSERVDMTLHLCNAEVDAHRINPRAAELDLESELRAHGAKAANVRVERRDCPRGSSGTP